MVGWFYINDVVAAPVRMLEADDPLGVLTVEIAARFVPNRSILRGQTIVEYRNWPQRRAVRCLGAECVGSAMMIEAVDIGPAQDEHETLGLVQGRAEDWLAINGNAFCQITDLSASEKPNGHCLFRVALTDWRDLRIGDGAPLASVGITLGAGQDNDGSIPPLLHSAKELPLGIMPPRVEIIRLRERQRLVIEPIATDWGDETTLVVARISASSTLRHKAENQTVGAS